MAENKKTIKNPPSRLQKKILKYSTADSWQEATQEWHFGQYYITQKTKSCCCSPREIKNVVVIKNETTGCTIEICRTCAELYFGITDIQHIENSVRRLNQNINLNMNKITLNYLLANKIISKTDYNNYEIVYLRRDSNHRYSKEINIIRKDINTKLLSFTEYENKRFFETADYMLGSSQSYPRLDPMLVFIERQRALSSGKANVDTLYYIMDEYAGDGADYYEGVRNQLLDEALERSTIVALTRYLDLNEYYGKITDFSPFGMPKPSNRRARRKSGLTKYELEHLADGLEDGVIDLDDNIDYDEDCEWDESRFEEDDFTFADGELVEEFMIFLSNWLKEDMEKHNVEQNPPKSYAGEYIPYTMDLIVKYVDIDEVTDTFECCKDEIHCLHNLLVENGLSIKHTYVVLDKLIRGANLEERRCKLKILKKMISKYHFALFHDDHITCIKKDEGCQYSW